jgi:signal transduction histidine kinase
LREIVDFRENKMKKEKKEEITKEQLEAFAESYASFNETIQKLHQAYKELEQKFESLNLELENTNRELHESLEYQKSLLDTIVHEIDAPVVAIRGIVERLTLGITKERMDIPKQLLKLRDINELCHLLFVLEKNVLLAESKEVREIKNIKYWDIERELINKAVNFMKPLLRNRDLPLDRIHVHLSRGPVYIKVNGDLFLQVFFNLLSNAIKCAHEDPDLFKIDITSEYSLSSGLILYFSDWGIGIPEGETNIIFEKRQRGSNIVSSPGMGLGLWVAKRILAAYTCDIWVEQKSGPTKFAIKIPNYLLFEKKLEGDIV